MVNSNLLSYRFALALLKRKCAIALILLLSHKAYGQVFKNVGVSSGVNFTPLEWEYRYSGSEPIENQSSERQPVSVNLYLTADLVDKKAWAISSSLGWILKKGMLTEMPGLSVSVPYKLDYVSWINSVKGKTTNRKTFVF